MKLKIVSKGTPATTKVTDEHGNVIEGVRFVSWEIGMDRLAEAKIEIWGVPVYIESEINTLVKLP